MASSRILAPLAGALALLAAAPAARAEEPSEAEAPRVSWIAGPAKVDVGSLAEVQLPEPLIFAGEKDAQALLERMGNVVDGSELGLVAPKSDDEGWFIVFEWNPIGYVKDDEKDEIDADELLESIKKGTEDSNGARVKRGGSALHVVGWAEPPHYDSATNNLTWAILAKDDEGGQVVNYNVRVLGRTGVMSVTLVDDPERLAASKPAVESVLAAFSYKTGKKYAEWIPGDKVAEYGLTALVAAGAGAAAVKLGLFAALAKVFAKAGKAIVLGIAALGGVAAKAWNALRGRKAAAAAQRPPQDPGAGA
jgi:uncharacterized membrane-anchored protein